MNLLIYTHAFAPSVGGIETIVMALAKGLAEASPGPDRGKPTITLVTRQPRAQFDDSSLPFRVVRRPSPWHLLKLVRSANIIHLAGPALLPLFLSLLFQKPVVVEHHGYQAICPNGLLLLEPAKTVCPGHFQAGHYKQCWDCNRSSAGSVKSLAMLLLTFPRRWMCRHSTRNIAVSEHVKLRIRPLRSEVIYHGVPDASLPSNSATEVPLAGAPMCFAYAGRLVS
ncbi:MAG TPA: glycosyltransferase, partial [Candidatus Acidoferrales bacterium]|nr:glycosyltransferase [Candidatus Acidoferrales bacterium]